MKMFFFWLDVWARAGHWTEKKEFTCSLVHKLLNNCVSPVHLFTNFRRTVCSPVHLFTHFWRTGVHLFVCSQTFEEQEFTCSLVHKLLKNCVFTCSFVHTFLMNRSSLVHLFEQFELLICSKVLKKVFCRVFCFPSWGTF